MSEQSDRLRQARVAAGFKRQADAIRAFDFNRNTYKSNENGNAEFSYDLAEVYGKAFKVRAEWLFREEGPMRPTAAQRLLTAEVPIVGKAAAGPDGHFFDPYPDGGHPTLDPFPEGSIAVVVDGDSMEPRFFKGEKIVFGPMANNIIRHTGEEVLAHLSDGRNLIKILEADKATGSFNLRSYNPRHESITAAPIEWVRPFLGLTAR